MFDTGIHVDEFISVNSGGSTPVSYEWFSKPAMESHKPFGEIRDKLNIDFLTSGGLPAEALNSDEIMTGLDKKCSDRLTLLARAYGEKQASEDQRALLARIEMIESEIEATTPRYTEADWALLERFKESIDKLAEGI